MKTTKVMIFTLLLSGLALGQSAFDKTAEGRTRFAEIEQQIYDGNPLFKDLVKVKAVGSLNTNILYVVPRVESAGQPYIARISDSLVKGLRQRALKPGQVESYGQAGFEHVVFMQVTSSTGQRMDGVRFTAIYLVRGTGLQDVTLPYLRSHGGAIKSFFRLSGVPNPGQ
jgi:hypothetical protein